MILGKVGLLLSLDCFPTGLVLPGGLGVLISSNSFTFTPGGIGNFVKLFGLEMVVLFGFVVAVCCKNITCYYLFFKNGFCILFFEIKVLTNKVFDLIRKSENN